MTYQYKVAGSAPRLSSTSKFFVWVSNTRMSVPCGHQEQQELSIYVYHKVQLLARKCNLQKWTVR